MQRSLEETAVVNGDVSLCYDTFGSPDDPALLLIMGLAGPLTWWNAELCELLAGRGFHVVRFDNRDVGRSTQLHDLSARRTDVLRAFVLGKTVPPYTLSDMAADAVGLLDHLGIDRAHVTGASMGGMIAQTMAIDHPGRVRSLVSIMSTTGKRSVGWQDPRLFPRLLGRGRHHRTTFIEQSVRTWAAIGSPAYPTPPDEIRQRAGDTFDRGVATSGVLRQMQAVVTQPDRSTALQQLDIPALVVHGLADRLVHVSGGRATAQAIPGAELLLIPGMGHDLPRPLWPTFADGIERTARRAGAAPTPRSGTKARPRRAS
ncbi:MAG: alpha/beta hydrolase [Nocardioidaceae bacterium]